MNIKFMEQVLEVMKSSKSDNIETSIEKLIKAAKDNWELDSLIEINEAIVKSSTYSDSMKETARMFLDKVSVKDKSSTWLDALASLLQDFIDEVTQEEMSDEDKIKFIKSHTSKSSDNKVLKVQINDLGLISGEDFIAFDKLSDMPEYSNEVSVTKFTWTEKELTEAIKKSKAFMFDLVFEDEDSKNERWLVWQINAVIW